MKRAMTLGAVLAVAGPAVGQGLDPSDVVMRVVAGSVETGRVENGAAVFPRFVVGATLGEIGIPNVTTNPGFDSTAGTFAPQTVVGVSVRRALRRWNGSGFSAVTAGETVTLSKGVASVSTPAADPTDCGRAGSLTLGIANSAGRVHEHPAWRLNAGPGQAGPGDGVYAVELEVWRGAAGSGVSRPVWVVLNQNADEPTFSAAVSAADALVTNANLCPANCDGSTTNPALNALDFSCFLGRYRAGECSANCDGSTTFPVLNALDFGCFLQRYQAGCP